MAAEKATVDEERQLISEPIHYASSLPDNELRRCLIHALNEWYNVPQREFEIISSVLELVHSASMLIDDVEDNAQMRGGLPAAFKVYGLPLTVNAAGMAYMTALETALALNNAEVPKTFVKNMMDFHRGQGIEIWWRENYVCPSEAEYCNMIDLKVGSLLNLTVDLMKIFAQRTSKDVTPVLRPLARLIQMRNDYINLSSSEHVPEFKNFAEDITEGKFSLPIIHAINSREGDTRIVNILKQHTVDIDLKSYCIQLLEEFGSLSYTRDYCFKLEDEINAALAELGPNNQIGLLLDELMEAFHVQSEEDDSYSDYNLHNNLENNQNEDAT